MATLADFAASKMVLPGAAENLTSCAPFSNWKVISYMLSAFLSVRSVETAAGGMHEVHLRRPLRGIHTLYYNQIQPRGQALHESKNFLYSFQKLSNNCAS